MLYCLYAQLVYMPRYTPLSIYLLPPNPLSQYPVSCCEFVKHIARVYVGHHFIHGLECFDILGRHAALDDLE